MAKIHADISAPEEEMEGMIRGGAQPMSDTPESGSSQIIIYQAEDGQTRLEVRLEQETVWLTQQLMAELFQTTQQNIGQHLGRISSEGELTENAVVKKFFTTASDGKSYKTNFYNLDAIISVGYRIKSHIATRFRQWATRRLREYLVKGFVLDDERLKNPDQPFDYFDELLRRIPMHMKDWIKTLDGFLTLNDRNILDHAGNISHQMAKELAEAERLRHEATTTHPTAPWARLGSAAFRGGEVTQADCSNLSTPPWKAALPW
ncbi:MAG: virulence RhuM family protein [Syntrophobacteraceae bacterium]